jgi:hypothetical protein
MYLPASQAPKVVVEWLKFLLRFRWVQCSNFGQEGSYVFPQSLQANPGIVPQNQVTTTSFHIRYNLLLTYHSFTRRYIILVTKKASLNQLKIPAFASFFVVKHKAVKHNEEDRSYMLMDSTLRLIPSR